MIQSNNMVKKNLIYHLYWRFYVPMTIIIKRTIFFSFFLLYIFRDILSLVDSLSRNIENVDTIFIIVESALMHTTSFRSIDYLVTFISQR